MADLLGATGAGVVLLREEEDGWHVDAFDVPRAQCVAVQTDGDLLFAGSRGSGLWRSGDRGRSWAPLDFPELDVFSVAVSPVDGTVYAGTEPSKLFRSTDGGESWEELAALRELPSAPTWSFPPRPWTSHVRWIAPSPHEADRLLVGIELGGLMMSEDGGVSWQDHRPGAQPDVHSLAWHPTEPGRAYEAGGGGAAWSSDGGRTWHPADVGRDRNYTWSVAVDLADPECWFVSASPGPMNAHRVGQAEAYIYRWRGDGPWKRLGGGLPQPLDAMPYALLALDERLVAGLSDGRIFTSADGGDTWSQAAVGGDALPSLVALASFSSD
jgi:photosystem II stability/assembly factor-like uncharacterized protein